MTKIIIQAKSDKFKISFINQPNTDDISIHYKRPVIIKDSEIRSISSDFNLRIRNDNIVTINIGLGELYDTLNTTINIPLSKNLIYQLRNYISKGRIESADFIEDNISDPGNIPINEIRELEGGYKKRKTVRKIIRKKKTRRNN